MEEKKIKRILEEYKKETKRHFDVVAEKIEDKIALVAEQVGANTEKLKEHDLKLDSISEKLKEHDLKFENILEKLKEHDQKLKEHDKRFDKIEDTLEVIKLDIEFIKNELKQKVGRDEFAALEKRVSLLEAKVNKLK
jgi:chromosome segregation ATPase